MGGLCSVYKDASSSDVEMDAPDSERISSKLVKHPKRKRPPVHITNTLDSNGSMDKNQYDQVRSLDVSVEKRRGPGKRSDTVLDEAARAPTTADDYHKQRDEIRSREAALAWDFLCKDKASRVEKEANEILQAMRRHDDEHTYAKAPSRRGYRGQEHPRFMGDHFLYNVDLIEETLLFQVARKMPKGAHLHIHFNANLLPHVLIDIAKTMDRMFITSNRPLIPVGRNKNDPGYYHNFDQSRIQFSILSPENEEQKKREWLPKNERQKKEVNLFDPSYPMEDEADKRPPMNFQEFREQFGAHYTRCTVEKWLEEKLVFHDEEAHGMLQTAEGAWDRFNARTQMMKGLFNYESAYRKYTRLCLQEFVDDNIQYAEIRPNFMTTNQLWTDDGESRKDNEGIMEIIIEECESFQRDTKQYFAGIKVIYCTPRSFEPELVQKSLDQCLEFKKKWPQWIAGFDLVGEESKGKPLKAFIPELLAFKNKCKAQDVDIPFLFHCGETLDVGSDTDGNLFDALLLGAKRIGHGFALARHPYVMEQMKKNNICLELCPISNEILGLTPRANGHAMYNLLANNVHCTVNTDNGTLFRSRLSHDFYQVFAGKKDMTLYGWKQLAEWSIEHSCLGSKLQSSVLAEWRKLWDAFCTWIVKEYGTLVKKTEA